VSVYHGDAEAERDMLKKALAESVARAAVAEVCRAAEFASRLDIIDDRDRLGKALYALAHDTLVLLRLGEPLHREQEQILHILKRYKIDPEELRTFAND
jgi:hypothetical protein